MAVSLLVVVPDSRAEAMPKLGFAYTEGKDKHGNVLPGEVKKREALVTAASAVRQYIVCIPLSAGELCTAMQLAVQVWQRS